MPPQPSNVLVFRQELPQLSTLPFSTPQPELTPEPSRALNVLLGPSPAMARVWSQIRRLAPHFRTALISGEPGTGAEAAAHALHSLSPLSERPFLTLSAADLERRAAASLCDGSEEATLFFPEVEKLSPSAQRMLLNLMRRRRGRGTAIIAATSTDLRPLVSAGSFSSSLAIQLASLQLTLPSLRQRREDIPALATEFLAHQSHSLGLPQPSPSPEFLDSLQHEDWPGNLDQLRDVLRRCLEHEDAPMLDPGALGPLLVVHTPDPTPHTEPVRLLKLDQVIHEHIRGVLMRCNGNKLRAAEVLGISRSTLYRMLDAQSVLRDNLPIAI